MVMARFRKVNIIETHQTDYGRFMTSSGLRLKYFLKTHTDFGLRETDDCFKHDCVIIEGYVKVIMQLFTSLVVSV